MKKPFYIITLVISIFFLGACNGQVQETPKIPAPSVKILDLSEDPRYQINEVGTIKAVQEVELISKAAGTIGQLSVKVGDPVVSGQALAVIDFDESNNPARVNYDSAQLQLSNARQTYSQVLANNQDSITRANLRMQTLETSLGRLQRNLNELKTTNSSTQKTLELQLKNAEKNSETAEVNYENTVAQFDQSWLDLLSSTKTSLDGVLINLESNFFLIRSILNPGSTGLLSVGDLSSGFGVRDSLQRLRTVNSFNAFRKELEQAQLSYAATLPLTEYTVDSSIDLIQSTADSFRLLIGQVRILFNNSISNNQLSETTLDTHKTSVSSAEAAVIADTAIANGLDQSLQTFKLDRTSQVVTAENNRVIAINQLADSTNAVLNFQTTGVGSIQDLEVQIEQTSNDLLSAQADLDSARRSAGIQSSSKNLEINTLNNQLRLAEQSLENNQVTSSINGVLSELVVDEGDYVSLGTYLGKVIQHEQVKVVFFVSKDNADRLNYGQSFNFKVAENSTEEFTGIINKISPSANPQNKKIKIEGAVQNEDFVLKPETFITLNLDLSTETFDLTKVYTPMNSIIFAQNAQYVYVLENGQAVRRDVEVGNVFGVWIEILSGLTKQDILIVDGQRNLPPGGNVDVQLIQ